MSHINTLSLTYSVQSLQQMNRVSDVDWHSVLQLEADVLALKSHWEPADLSSHDVTAAKSWHWAYTPFIWWQAPWISQKNANGYVLAVFVAWKPVPFFPYIYIYIYTRSPLIRSLSSANLAREIAAPIKFQTTNTQPQVLIQSGTTVRKKENVPLADSSQWTQSSSTWTRALKLMENSFSEITNQSSSMLPLNANFDTSVSGCQ